jgi:hypothetical protein
MTIKKIVLGFILCMALLLFIPWLIGYLEYGQLDVTTNSHLSTITLTKSIGTKNSGSKAFSEQAHGSISARLKSGSYLVSVQLGSNSTAEYITVKAHSTKHVTINLVSAGGVEPVTYDFAQDVVADSSRLIYLASDDFSLNELGSQNTDTQIDSNYTFQAIAWANTSFGVGQEPNGKLFVIQNGSVSPLNSPVSNQNDSSLIFAVAPNKNIYLALGSSVYSGTASGGFKKIYADRESGAILAPGLAKVTLINTGYSGVPASLVTVDNSGKQLERQQNTFINTWSSWSPHDKYIAVNGASAGEVLNSSMQEVATIPQGNFTNPVWLNDNTLFYSINDQLWSYNVQTQRSQVIANMPNGEQIKELTVSTDGAYIYLVTSDSSNNQAIRRVGLQGQQVPDDIYQLQDFLLIPPTPGAGYAFGLVNFSGEPVVQVIISDGSSGPASIQSAQQILQADGFNTSKLQLTIVYGD